jgi:hypothetical protein
MLRRRPAEEGCSLAYPTAGPALSFRDANGRWLVKASIAKTKTEARRLAEEIEQTFDR